MLSGNYNALLVLFSLLVAILASYTALDLVGRISSATGRVTYLWLTGGAVAMGLGVWSMHFVGMLAFSLPVQMSYDIPLTLASLVIAIAASGLAMWFSSRPTLSAQKLCSVSLVMGGGIAAMHYTGMAAMEMSPGIIYIHSLVVLSIVIAVAASGAALWIAHKLRRGGRYVRHFRIGAAVIMGIAIVAMHYTGMAAAKFPIGSVCGAAQDGLDAHQLALPILVITLAVLGIALVTSVLDMRLEINTAMLASSLAEANEELSHLALHDTLTRLPNRMLLMDRLKHAVADADASGTQFAVMFTDLDGFKSINDTFGHQTGDQLLIQVSERLLGCLQPKDTCARLGGDEFVMLSSLRVPADAALLADRLISYLEEPFIISGHHLGVTGTVGIAIYPGDGEDAAALLKNADIAMYHAKSLGRNQACFFEDSMNTDTASHLSLLQDLRGARKRCEFALHYQPKFDARADGPLIGVEALLRWHHPVRGMIAPDDFIPLAERTGLIVPIGEWVIDEACRQIGVWQRDGQPMMTMAVNISTLQFNHARFIPTVQDALVRHGVSAGSLTLEITESTAMQDVETSLAILGTLTKLGVRISIDDFGTGYSSLLHLKRMPASELKIDRGFITGLIKDSEDAAIVSAIIGLGETLKLNIVAEGVETKEQKELLARLGCDLLQGFYLGRPMPADAMTRLLSGHASDKDAAPEVYLAGAATVVATAPVGAAVAGTVTATVTATVAGNAAGNVAGMAA